MDKNVPTNTTKQDPIVMLAESLFFGPSEAIEMQEAQGQQELVQSDVLPTEILHSTKEDFEALGFVFGEKVEGDPMFQHVQLPAGWKKTGTEHSMWSKITDDRGIGMVSVFYKAAFYDRSAHMGLNQVGFAEAREHIYGDEETFVLNPALTEEEKADVKAAAEDYLKSATEYPDIYGDRAPRAQAVLDAVSAS